MIPPMIDEAAKEGGWAVEMFSDRHWFGLYRGDLSVHGQRDQFRHTTGRAYRGNALAGVFRTQREIADYLTDTRE